MSALTDAMRQALIESGNPTDELVAALATGMPVWDTEGLRADFAVEGFAAPFVVVRRRSDNVQGTLMFTHNPRYYFGFEVA